MSRFKIVAIILAGMLAIAPAAFARGGGGHGGGGFHGGGFRGGGSHGGHFGGYSSRCSEVTTAGTAAATAITGTGAVGMVALTTVADIGMEVRTGGVTHSVSGTMTRINNSIRPTTRMTGRTGRRLPLFGRSLPSSATVAIRSTASPSPETL